MLFPNIIAGLSYKYASKSEDPVAEITKMEF
jgi:hypothetical protein